MDPTRLAPSNRAALLVLAAIELVVLSSVWPRFWSPNEFSRVFAAHAFATRGEWEIDRELARFGFIDDVSVVDGRHYSNKAPGLIWAAVPVVAAVSAVAPSASIRTELFVSRVVLVSASAMLTAILLGLWVARRSEGALGADEAVFILLFASVFAVYAGTFFSHVWAASLLFAAAYLLLGPNARPGWGTDLAAGFCVTFAAVSEYPAALVGGAVLAAGCWGRWRRFPRVLAGAAAPLAGLGVYNHACFGSMWALSSRFEAMPRYRELAEQTLFGFSPPTITGLVGLLASPLVGLFFLFPVLAPALVAPVSVWRRGDRRLAVLLGTAVWVLPLVMSGYREWAGGASFGPRYLVLAVPLVVLGLATLPGRAARLWVLAAVIPSALVALLGRVTPPFAIDDVWTASTLRGWTLPALSHGLWNVPLATSSRTSSVVGLAVVFLVWWLALRLGLAEGRRRPRPARRLMVLALACVLLFLQLAVGRVTGRQRAWFRSVAPSFTVTADPQVSLKK